MNSTNNYFISEIKNILHSEMDYSETIEQAKNLCQQSDFYQNIKSILFETNDFAIPDKVSTLCFMKQFGIFLEEQQDFLLILHFLDFPDLRYAASQLIVSHYDNFDGLCALFDFLSEELKPSDYIILINTYIEMNKIINTEYPENIKKAVLLLYSFLENEKNTLKDNLSIIKCIILISKSIDDEETLNSIYQTVFDIFMRYTISLENEIIFFELLQLRSILVKYDTLNFYQKVKELSEFIVIHRGPPNNLNQASLNYYLSEIIFQSIENYEEGDLNPFFEEKEKLVSILFLFSVYDENEVDQWRDDVEGFFSSNMKYLMNENDENDEEDENAFLKESNELHEFIYKQIIKLGDFQFNESKTLLTLTVDFCYEIIEREIELYSNSLIKLSFVLFAMNIDQIIEFDLSSFLKNSEESQFDITFMFLILYLSKKNLTNGNEINEHINNFFEYESEMFKILIASILINLNDESINPEFYIRCFCECLKLTDSFYTEKLIGVNELLLKLADFENKPYIVPLFDEQMEEILEALIDELTIYQSAYLSTQSLCDLIAHFIRYIEFQEQLLPFFFTFIDNLCNESRSAVLGIRLIYAFLVSKTSPSALTKELLDKFYEIFRKYLTYFDIEYLNDNPDLIATIISILSFFVKKSLVDVADSWTLEIFGNDQLSSEYFTNISPLIVSLIKSGNSINCVEILKKLIVRANLFGPIVNPFDPDENPDGQIENPLINQAMLTLAHLAIDGENGFRQVLGHCKLSLIDILTAVNCHFFVNLNIADDRLIFVMFLKFGDQQISVFRDAGEEEDDNENLIFAIQLKAVVFFEKVIESINRNGLNGLFKSEFFEHDDDVFDDPWMKCPFSELAEKLFKEQNTGNYEIEKRKENILDIFKQRDL